MKIAPGVRLTTGTKSASLRFGPRGAGYSVSTSGRRTTSIGVPGTGLSYSNTTTTRRSRKNANTGEQAEPVGRAALERAIPKAGWFSSRAEKEFRAGVVDFLAGDTSSAIERLERSAANGRAAGAEIVLAYALITGGRSGEARPFLETLLAAGGDLPDRLMRKYLSSVRFALSTRITPEVEAELSPDLGSAAVALAEIYQDENHPEQAIDLLEGAGLAGADEAIVSLSLAELYAVSERWDDVLRVTDDVGNVDDASAARLIYRARAFRETGLLDAALEMNKASMRSKKRDPVLLRAARYDRAMTYGVRGNKRMWRKDLEQIHAEDRLFADVAQLLETDQ